MDPFKTMDGLGQTPPKDILSNVDGQNQATPAATTPVRKCACVEISYRNYCMAFACVCVAGGVREREKKLGSVWAQLQPRGEFKPSICDKVSVERVEGILLKE